MVVVLSHQINVRFIPKKVLFKTMKKASWFFFLMGGILSAGSILLGRYIGIEYVKLILLFITYLLSGLIIRGYSTLHDRVVLAFLFPAFLVIGWGFFSKHISVSSTLVESLVLGIGLNTGYYTRAVRGARKIYPVIFASIFILAFASFINPRIIAATRFGTHKKQLEEKEGQVIDFELTMVNGEKLSSRNLKGKTVLLDCWFINCQPCYDKLRYLRTLQDHYRKRSDVVIIAVDTERNKSFEDFSRQIKNLPPEIMYAYDPSGTLSTQLNLTSYPTEILLDSTGKLRDHFIGFNEDIALIYMPSTIKKINRISSRK